MAESEASSKTTEARHERRDLSPRNIAVFAASLAVTVILVGWVCYELFGHFLRVEKETQVPPAPLSISPRPVPGPRLVVNPGQDMQALRASEDAILNTYGWVDREKGIVRIPIDRAIELVAQTGLPMRPQIQRTPNGTKENSKGNRG
ncbi:MAG: hypothetical protein ACM3TN_09905 [Alphaproteobacteria bacterium]